MQETMVCLFKSALLSRLQQLKHLLLPQPAQEVVWRKHFSCGKQPEEHGYSSLSP